MSTLKQTQKPIVTNALRDELQNLGFESEIKGVDLTIPNDRTSIIKELVEQHLSSHGISTTTDSLVISNNKVNFLFIDAPEKCNFQTPWLSRIAKGISRWHNGARLAVDYNGISCKGETLGVYMSLANTILIPWTTVLEPNKALAGRETIGHELIHLKQNTKDPKGASPGNGMTIDVKPQSFIGKKYKIINSNEIETHLYNLRYNLRRLPHPDSIEDIEMTQLRKKLGVVASEAKFVNDTIKQIKDIIPLCIKAINNGEPILYISNSEYRFCSMVVARGTDLESTVRFSLLKGDEDDIQKSIKQTISKDLQLCKTYHETISEYQKISDDAYVKLILNNNKILKLLFDGVCFLTSSKDSSNYNNEYSKLYEAGRKSIDFWQDNATTSENLITGSAENQEIIQNHDDWISALLDREPPAIKSVLTSYESLKLSLSSYQKISKYLIKFPQFLNKFQREAEEIVYHLDRHNDIEGGLKFCFTLIDKLKKPTALFYNNLAFLLFRSEDKTGQALNYSKKSIALLKKEGKEAYALRIENFEDTYRKAKSLN